MEYLVFLLVLKFWVLIVCQCAGSWIFDVAVVVCACFESWIVFRVFDVCVCVCVRGWKCACVCVCVCSCVCVCLSEWKFQICDCFVVLSRHLLAGSCFLSTIFFVWSGVVRK